MPKSMMRSVVGQLQKERKRLEDELHRVTAALTAFGRVYLRGTKSGPAASRKKELSRPPGASGLQRLNGSGGQRFGPGRNRNRTLVRRSKNSYIIGVPARFQP